MANEPILGVKDFYGRIRQYVGQALVGAVVFPVLGAAVNLDDQLKYRRDKSLIFDQNEVARFVGMLGGNLADPVNLAFFKQKIGCAADNTFAKKQPKILGPNGNLEVGIDAAKQENEILFYRALLNKYYSNNEAALVGPDAVSPNPATVKEFAIALDNYERTQAAPAIQRVFRRSLKRAEASEAESKAADQGTAVVTIQALMRGKLARSRVAGLKKQREDARKIEADKVAAEKKAEEERIEAERKKKEATDAAAAKPTTPPASATPAKSTWNKIKTLVELKSFIQERDADGMVEDSLIDRIVGAKIEGSDGKELHTGIEVEEWGETCMVYRGVAGFNAFNQQVDAAHAQTSWAELEGFYQAKSMGGADLISLFSAARIEDYDGKGGTQRCLLVATKRGITKIMTDEVTYQREVASEIQGKWHSLRNVRYCDEAVKLLKGLKVPPLSQADWEALQKEIQTLSLEGKPENEAEKSANESAHRDKFKQLLDKHNLSDAHQKAIGDGSEERLKARNWTVLMLEDKAKNAQIDSQITIDLHEEDFDNLTSSSFAGLGEKGDDLLAAPMPLCPIAGIAILRSNNNRRATVVFNGKCESDIAWLNVPGAPQDNLYRRVMVCRADGPMTFYKDGELVTEDRKAGEIVIDTGVLHRFENGKYEVMSLDKKDFELEIRAKHGLLASKKDNKATKEFIKKELKKFDSIVRAVDDFEIKAISNNGLERGIAIAINGEVRSAQIASVATNLVSTGIAKEVGVDKKMFSAVEIRVIGEDGKLVNPEEGPGKEESPQVRLVEVRLPSMAGNKVFAKVTTSFTDIDNETGTASPGDIFVDERPHIIENGVAKPITLTEEELAEFKKTRIVLGINVTAAKDLSGAGLTDPQEKSIYVYPGRVVRADGYLIEAQHEATLYNTEQAYKEAEEIFRNVSFELDPAEEEEAEMKGAANPPKPRLNDEEKAQKQQELERVKESMERLRRLEDDLRSRGPAPKSSTHVEEAIEIGVVGIPEMTRNVREIDSGNDAIPVAAVRSSSGRA